ncbi:MAG: energy transducer TonB [Acidobacteriaceae bacterium]
MIRCTRLCLLFVFLQAFLFTGAVASAFAAKPKDGGSSLPKDPAALLALAAQHNGLTGPGLKPWHIKATYQLYDAKGNPAAQGTFEEWWAAPNKFKLRLTLPGSNFEFYRTPEGAYFSKDVVPFRAELSLLHWLIEPIPDGQDLKNYKLKRVSQTSGHSRFACVAVQPHGHGNGMNSLLPMIYCFSPNAPVLRFVETLKPDFFYGVLYESIAELQGRSLGESLRLKSSQRHEFTARIVSGEVIDNPVDAMFRPSSTALKSLTHVSASGTDAPFIHSMKKLSGQPPTYPPIAKQENKYGTVSVEATVGSDGELHQLKVVSSPSTLLTRSAIYALKTWRDEPYEISGVAVPVRTTIDIIDSFQRGF